MVEVNRMTTPANMRWKLVDRETGAENAQIDWTFRVGDQVKLRLVNEMDSDHPMPHPFHVHGAGRFLILARDDVVEPNLVWKDTVLVRTGETVDILLGRQISRPLSSATPARLADRQSPIMPLPSSLRQRRQLPETACANARSAPTSKNTNLRRHEDTEKYSLLPTALSRLPWHVKIAKKWVDKRQRSDWKTRGCSLRLNAPEIRRVEVDRRIAPVEVVQQVEVLESNQRIRAVCYSRQREVDVQVHGTRNAAAHVIAEHPRGNGTPPD